MLALKGTINYQKAYVCIDFKTKQTLYPLI